MTKSKVKECKFCKSEINKGANNCPNCQKDLRNWFSRHPIWTILIILFIIGSIGNNSMKDYSSNLDTSLTDSNTGINTVNNNGIWAKNYYADEFGDKTNELYITNIKNSIIGSFSNSAVNKATLTVNIAVNSSKNIDIFLYEYSGTNSTKEFEWKTYNINIKTEKGNIVKIKGINKSSDRIQINGKDAFKLYNLLISGEQLKFSLIDNGTIESTYNFIINSIGFSNISKKEKLPNK